MLVMMRYFIEVPAGCEARFTPVSSYKCVPSSSVARSASVVVAQVVPPSRETAAARSVLREKEVAEDAAKRSLAIEGEEVAVNVEERRSAVAGV